MLIQKIKFSRDRKIVALLLVIFHIFLFTGIYLEGIEPVTTEKKVLPKFVEIEKGESPLSIARKLKREGLINSVPVFLVEALRKGVYRDFKAGEYALYPNQKPSEIIDTIIKGKVYLHKITIPEGATLWQIAEALEAEKICRKDEFLKMAENSEFIRELGLPGPTAEGYLYPETYFFAKNTPPAKVIKTITDKFKEVWRELEPLASGQEFSMREIIILASIVEKEAFYEGEKPLIAAVYLNRLKKGMPLQADPTINYALKNFRRLTYRDYYEVKSPYNTYLHRELPPTPIGNPSKSSILAVLKPAKVPYLYFVATEDKRHIFSRTYGEHLAAIEKIRKRKEGTKDLSREREAQISTLIEAPLSLRVSQIEEGSL